jgi:hypothetical protein
VQFCKLTQGVVKYKLRMEAKNRDSFDCRVKILDNELQSDNDVLEGQLSDDMVNIEISISSSKQGQGLAYFYIEIEDGPPVSFSCQADFRGPIVSLLEPVVDLGLAKVNTQQTFTLTIENKSPIKADFCIKNSKNKKLSISNFVSDDQASMEEENGAPISSHRIVGRPIGTKKGNKVNFDTTYGSIPPRQTISITLTCDCINQESIEEYFEIMIRDSKSLFF